MLEFGGKNACGNLNVEMLLLVPDTICGKRTSFLENSVLTASLSLEFMLRK